MLQTMVRVLRRFVILFVSFILGGVAGFSLFAFFRTLYATLGFVVPVILFAFILFIDRGHRFGNSISFLAGGVAGLVLFFLLLFLLFAGIPNLHH